MRVAVALASVNDNPAYYRFVPAQVRFWGRWGIRFVAVLAAPSVPQELQPYVASGNVIHWNRDLDLAGSYLGQHLRIWYPALLKLPDDAMVLITDMDMLPVSREYFCGGIESFVKHDFVHYWSVMHHVPDVPMCYSAAHPDTWAHLTGVRSEADVSARLREHYPTEPCGPPGSRTWWLDQRLMYKLVARYEHLRELHRRPQRLDVHEARDLVARGVRDYIDRFSDAHFHRDHDANAELIRDLERQHSAAPAASAGTPTCRAIVGYCIYGTQARYTQGLWRNLQRLAELSAAQELPLDRVLVVAGDDAPAELLDRIEATWPEMCTVERLPFRGQRLMFERFVRTDEFAAKAGDGEFTRPTCIFVRDADSRVTARDLWCMRQFLDHPTAVVQAVRDHMWHRKPIMGGSAGWRAGMLPPMRALFNAWKARQGKPDADIFHYGADERFLEESVYPLAMSRPGGFVAYTSGICRHRGERRGEHVLPIQPPRQDDHDFVGNVMLIDAEGAPDRPAFGFLSSLRDCAMYHIGWLDNQGAHEEIAETVRLLGPADTWHGVPDSTRQALLLRLYLAQYYSNAPREEVRATFRMFAHAPVNDFIISQVNYWLVREQGRGGLRLVGVTDPEEANRLLAEPEAAAKPTIHVIYAPADGSAARSHRWLPGGPVMLRHPRDALALRHEAFVCTPGWERVARIAIIARPGDDKAVSEARYAALLNELSRIGAPIHRIARYTGDEGRKQALERDSKPSEGVPPESAAILVLDDDVAFAASGQQVAMALRAALERPEEQQARDPVVVLAARHEAEVVGAASTLRIHPAEQDAWIGPPPGGDVAATQPPAAYLVTRPSAALDAFSRLPLQGRPASIVLCTPVAYTKPT